MNHLIVYCHPNPASFCKAIADTIEKTSLEKGHQTRVRDLYALGFDPKLKPSDFEAFQAGRVPEDIGKEQQHIAWAETITFVYPIWWTGLPATLKGYIDRVFSYGFAYKYGDRGPVGLLTGKKVIVFNTSGSPNEIYATNGMHAAIQKTSDVGIFEFCGMEVVRHEFFGAVPFVDDETRRGYLKAIGQIADELL
jgi:NAD(P)H dehydrogenase (quinone)